MAGQDQTNFTIFRTIKEIDQTIWDSTNIPAKICLSYNYLSALEQASPAGMHFRYAVIYKNRLPAGIAVFQLLSLVPRIISKKIKSIDFKKKTRVGFHLLICGNGLNSGEYAYSKSINSAEFFGILKKVIKQVKSDFDPRYHIIGTIIKDTRVDSDDNQLIQNQQFYPFSPLPNMVIPNLAEFQDMEHYIAAMKNKYRSRIRSTLKKGAIMERRDLSLPEIIKYRDLIYQLYLEVHNRSRFRLTTLNPQVFEKWKEQLGEDYTLTGYFIREKMIAFTTRFFSKTNCLLEGDTHGLAYSLNKTYEIYQNILLDDIKAGIKRKVEKISFGRTSIAMKSSVGATPEPLTFFARINLPLTNKLFMPWLQQIKIKNEYCRNPFNKKN
jgi:hypothetical protein